MPRAKGGSIPPPRVNIPPGHGGAIATLNDNDVLSGRGGRINNHPGNIMFRTIVEDYKHEYLDPRTRKLEKAHVAARLVAQIRSTNPPGRFLREDPDNPGKFVEIGDQKAWKKAGQALREDAPDVRKEIDEEVEVNVEQVETPQQRQQPAYHQQQRPPGVPAGIPPSVSYSPSSGPMPLAPPSSAAGGARPDPPEAPGVTGYRQKPLVYFESGRGGRGQPGHFPGRGRGPAPPPHHHVSQQPHVHPQQQQPQQYPSHPQQGYHHPHPAYYGHPPPPGQPYPPPGPQYQQHPAAPMQYQQTYHHPQQYPPQHGHPVQQQHPNGMNPGPQPQFTAPLPQDKKQNRKKPTSTSPMDTVAAGILQTMDAVSGLADRVTNKVIGKPSQPSKMGVPSAKGSDKNQDFPPTMSVGTDFTMSDVSALGESRRMSGIGESSKTNPPQRLVGGGGAKQSTGTTSSSSKSRESFTMSDLTFGLSGRTRSFPDLMLSTGDLLPPLQSGESDKEDSNNEPKEQRSGSRRILRPPFHRHSSSESSNHSMASLTIKGFHPVRGRSNTAMSGLNDAMSIMSIDSRKSIKSETSSWLENFRSMQSIHSDMNPWDHGASLRGNSQLMGDEGSVRSFLSDVSNELNALDLAGPLLPPILTDTGLNDSGDFMMVRPDP